ncbi:hypothetical protein V6U90_19805 [Micromonospora sp. CPCC 206060]|uniref:hypothetical protein n=1 Tax=Micromonospora sp. CPCC 206060 TaxID=3122406 RepID=UPI002FF4026C
MTEPVVIVCPDCTEPTQDASVPAEPTRGAGLPAGRCSGCGGQGRRRAQLTYTVANLDTGAVASRTIGPGSLPPVPDGRHGWQLDCAPLIRELAESVAAVGLRQVGDPDRGADAQTIGLPSWRPYLTAGQRRTAEAEALARQDHQPWRLFLGRNTAPPVPAPESVLARLCAVADLLCLDLVVEARRQHDDHPTWDIRYELPGAKVPAGPRLTAVDLPTAVTATTVDDALAGLTDRGRTAPAYAIRPAGMPPARPPVIDLDQLARRVDGDCAGAAGAQAIWRDGRWWHTQLRPGSPVHPDSPEGSPAAAVRLLRVPEPPAPSWRGEPIPHRPCPDCFPGSPLRRCYCTLGGHPPRLECPACQGAGYAASALACPTCHDSGRQYDALAVTVTDLHSRVGHELWQPDAAQSATLVARPPLGPPVHQLPKGYRLGRWAGILGVRPEDLTDLDGGHEIGQDLRDGIVVTATENDPIVAYLRTASAGQPGARLLVLAATPDVPPLTEVTRLALGLHLGIAVTVADHRHHDDDPTRLHGQRWEVDILPPGAPVDRLAPPVRPTLEHAIGFCLESLDNALAAVPTDATQPIIAPQNPAPPAMPDPLPLLTRLASRYPGHPVTVVVEPTGYRAYLHEATGPRPLTADHGLVVG